ncbi:MULTISPECIES: tRNA pseudouridine synthase A [Micrococcales]|uniref:tRNA pseudouridine synthase A n=1 Tax=Micrococcales TaxID=85006 RepID=UPI0009E7F7C5|nr:MULTISPECIES: tRNA pseudouridine synthase A [Micrococcales]
MNERDDEPVHASGEAWEHPLGAVSVADPVSGQALVRVRLDLGYDGGYFSGWAKQPGLITVEGCLEEAAHLVLRDSIKLTVAGRTDAGVHAAHQVVHFDLSADVWERLPGRRGADGVGTDESGASLVRKFNGALSRILSARFPPDRPGAPSRGVGAIVVHGARRVDPGFDARFSALSRSYTYRIADGLARQSPLNRATSYWTKTALDVSVLNAAGDRLVGLHDFLSFCKPRAGATTIRNVQSVEFRRAATGLIEARISADAFCHNMVRAIVGSCVLVAEGKRDLAWLDSRLAEPVRDSSVRLAPPEGLILERVDYPEDPGLWAWRAEQTRAKRTASGS